MPKYTIADLQIPDWELRACYERAKQANGITWMMDLDGIFEVALRQRDLFPSLKMHDTLTAQEYLNRWVKNYLDAMNRRPSTHRANPKTACTDPAIRVIVQASRGLTDAAAARYERNHNLFMSAENIQGNLLEEYIAGCIRPYGFLWCAGNVLRAVDFCNAAGTLLQIKNKSNTENSSGSAIREGTSINKWYRLGTRTEHGMKLPDYKWDGLNRFVNEHKTAGYHLPPCNMNEGEYQAFLFRVAGENQNLITDC